MSWLKENKLHILLIYINIIFVMMLIKDSYVILNFNYMHISLLYLIVLLLYWFFVSALRGKIAKISFLLLLAGTAALYCLRNIGSVKQFIMQNIVDKAMYINSLVAQGIVTSYQDFFYLILFIIPLFTIILLFLASKGFGNSLLIFTLAVTTALWYFGYTEVIKKYLFYYMLLSLTTYCINAFLRNMKRLSKKGIKVSVDNWKILVYTVLASTIIALITNFLPQEYNGRYVSDIRSRIYNKYAKPPENPEEKGKELVYDLSYSGYDNNKRRLGGPVVLNKLISFRVKSDMEYYLRGNVKDLYDGFSWDRTSEKYNLKKPDMTDNFFGDLFSRELVGSSNTLTIYPEELNTSTMFTPPLVYMANTSDSRDIYFDDIPTLMSNGNITKPYDIFFYNLNAEGKGLLSEANQLKQKEIRTSYYQENYKRYLQVPDNISARIYDLVYNLVKNKRNNFEKVNAIRDYLRKNYKYSLDVSVVPEDQEFLDYFLFVEKKGYCTYFATAETIMCRIAGIPARYVEGFNMPSEKDDNGYFVVRNENAHAWAEVLFRNFSGYGLWYTVDAVPDAVDIVHKEEEQKKEELLKGSTPNTQAGTQGQKNVDVDNEDIASEASKQGLISKNVIRIIYTILVLMSIHLIFVFVYWLRKRKLLGSSSIIPVYKHSLQRLESLGITRIYTDSDMEFIEKLSNEIKPAVKQAASFAYREYYGEKPPEAFNRIEYYNLIESYVRKKQNLVKYFTKKYYFIEKISFIIGKVVLLYKKTTD